MAISTQPGAVQQPAVAKASWVIRMMRNIDFLLNWPRTALRLLCLLYLRYLLTLLQFHHAWAWDMYPVLRLLLSHYHGL
jgi:hypothetical protein